MFRHSLMEFQSGVSHCSVTLSCSSLIQLPLTLSPLVCCANNTEVSMFRHSLMEYKVVTKTHIHYTENNVAVGVFIILGAVPAVVFPLSQAQVRRCELLDCQTTTNIFYT